MRIIAIYQLAVIILLSSGCSIIHATRVESAVLKALKDDPRTSQYDFQVVYEEDGVVSIAGTVYGGDEVAAVAEVAGQVEGVEKVINQVHIEDGGSGMMQDTVVPSPFF